MFTSQTQFSLVGERDYIQGIVMVTAICEAVCREAGSGPFLATLVKFPHITNRNGKLVTFLDADEPAPAAANCLVAGACGARAAGGYFLSDADGGPAPRVPNHTYDIRDFVIDGEFSGRCRLCVATAPEWALHLVEASKRMVARTLADTGRPERRIELVTIENLPYIPDMEPADIGLKVENAGVRAFRSRLYVRTHMEHALPGGGTASIVFTYSAY